MKILEVICRRFNKSFIKRRFDLQPHRWLTLIKQMLKK